MSHLGCDALPERDRLCIFAPEFACALAFAFCELVFDATEAAAAAAVAGVGLLVVGAATLVDIVLGWKVGGALVNDAF